jgi:SAM-dependent methyltransferase
MSVAEIRYDYARLLRDAFPRRYPLYRALCNNGFVSYHELAEGSVSLPSRADVAEFGAFLAERIPAGARVLDVGCGPLATPGYLESVKARGGEFAGLDIYPTTFAGLRITGCAEFLPLRDGCLDAVIFATSLDHVCDLHATLREVRRVLRPGGGCFIWMSDRKPYWREFFFCRPTALGVLRRVLLSLPKQIMLNFHARRRLLYGVTHYFTRGRFWEYANGSVFYCPPGAVDPFHSFFESPAEVVSLASRHDLTRAAFTRGLNGVYLHLERSGSLVASRD